MTKWAKSDRVFHLKGGWGQEFPHLWGQKLTSGFGFFLDFVFFGGFFGLGAKNSDLWQNIHLCRTKITLALFLARF